MIFKAYISSCSTIFYPKGPKAVEAISSVDEENLCFSKEAMKNMKMLRILYIWYGGFNNCLPGHDGSIEYLPNNLRWFVWYNFPCESLPENFKPKMLVHLYLKSSSLSFMEGNKAFAISTEARSQLLCTPHANTRF
ncbi:TMV resistance protein N-like [Lycium ferocissimum]|uniref:TMV resistance protein N-like n=1 Tax=Lycium ferocissimum TaxID=112874 RepID=UPI002815423F|nr:TMV resistance protein N-like [Lycium ferocissimum]